MYRFCHEAKKKEVVEDKGFPRTGSNLCLICADTRPKSPDSQMSIVNILVFAAGRGSFK